MDRYIEKILSARVYDVAIESPLEEAPALSRRLGNRMMLKREDLQKIFSFKIRGAHNKIWQLARQQELEGVVASSAGNHAQGVAYAAREFGLEALIVMPEDAPDVKREATRALGGRVVFEGYTTEERKRRALEIAAEEGYTVVPPFDHPDIIAGQGTVGLEVVEQLREAARRGGRDPDAAEDERAGGIEPVGVVPEADAHGRAPGSASVRRGGAQDREGQVRRVAGVVDPDAGDRHSGRHLDGGE